MPVPKVEHLIVDTTAFIKNENLQNISSNIYTVQGVVNEITNKRQLRNLVVLPYDLRIKDVFPENIKFVTEFSKKTGDYTSLSAVDIQVMALTYQLEKEHVGSDHLHSEPRVARVASFSEQLPSAHLALAGFYMPPQKEITVGDKETENLKSGEELGSKPDNVKTNLEEGSISKEDLGEELKRNLALEAEAKEAQAIRELEEALRKAVVVETPSAEEIELEDRPSEQDLDLDTEAKEAQAIRELEETLGKAVVVETPNAEEIELEDRPREEDFSSDEVSESDNSDIWDDKGWITPENLDDIKRELRGAVEEEAIATVACITGDFAMQNVLRQLGLKVLAVDGRSIKQMRTFILRCYACNKTTSKMELLFCPHCGNKTLRKAAVLLKSDGTEEIQFTWRRPPTGRGKRFSLPKPQGGKHVNNPILCADQRFPQQYLTKLSRTKNNPLDPDYIAGFSPFVMRDVTSQSSVLGIRNHHTQIKNWMRRNPNEVVKKGKGRKKK